MLFVAQCTLVEGAMHSGKKPQSILVKSDDFENSFSLLYILLKSCLCCCSLATLAPQQQLVTEVEVNSGGTATWLAQLVGRQSAVREVEGSNPRPDQHLGS